MELGAQLGVSGTPTVMVNVGGQVRRVAAGFDAILVAVNDLSPSAEGGPGGGD
jgi:protein-disulfide isomerase